MAGTMWERWYSAVTGQGVVLDLPDLGWSSVIRLHRRDLGIENPGFIAARVVHMLGKGRLKICWTS